MADKQPKTPPMEKGLPAATDVERLVLGSILNDGTTYVTAAGSIDSDVFTLESHRRIFRRMADLHERGASIDYITLHTELQDKGESESVGGLTYLTSLTEGIPQLPNIDEYLHILKEKATLRQLIFKSQHIMNRCLLGEDRSNAILADAREAILTMGADATDDGPQRPAQIIEQAGGVTAFLTPPKDGLLTGFTKLDEMTGGLHPGEFFILAARPSAGKSAMALNIVQHIVLKQKKAASIFSLEMSKQQLLLRMACAAARVDSQRVRHNYLSQEERRKLNRALYELAEANLYIDDKSAATAADLHARVRRLMANGPLDLVVVDYLQLMSGGKSSENRNQEVSTISRGLKLMAGDLHIPVMALSQLSRAPELRRGNNRPQLSDLRESGSLEQDCDTCAFIFREEMYAKDREDLRGLAELLLAKQRNGPTGTVHLVFLHSLTKFENRAEDVGEDVPPPMLRSEDATRNRFPDD